MKTQGFKLNEIVDNAEMILVGIGYEYRIANYNLEEDSKYNRYLKMVEVKDELKWLNAFLRADYCMNYEGIFLKAYEELYKLIGNKDYFVVSVNDDSIIDKTNFNQERVVSPCGTYRLMQCENNCNGVLYKSAKLINEVLGECRRNFKELQKVESPRCPNCGANLVFNNLQTQNYNESGYLTNWESYTKWLQASLNKKICILELGVGMEFPTIIRWPFEKIAFYNQKSKFVRIHHKLFQLTQDIKENGISIQENAVNFFANKIV